MAIDPIHAFYCSKDYLTLAQSCKIKSSGICARCGGIFDISELRPHHIKELTLDNIDDINITLNPNNIEVLCHACHNAVHARFGNVVGQKHIYLVYGSPCAGKNTFVETVASRNDLIVDLDKIHKSICICGMYDKPDATKKVAFDIRNFLFDVIRYAGTHRRWQNAYIIGTYPDRHDRDEMVRNYGVELIHIDTSKEDCIANCKKDISHKGVQDAVLGWIDNYWQRYTE